MRTAKFIHTSPTATQRGALVGLILVAMVSVPYLFPAPLSISRSYIAGFSNRVMMLILFIGTGILALWTRGRIGSWGTENKPLTWRSLAVALSVSFAFCLRCFGWFPLTLPGGEGQYFANRVQLLAAGALPYTQFEFVYGPLLLYPTLWLQKLLNLSVTPAYVLIWLLFWQIGVVFIWVVVREIDLPIASRGKVFAFLLVTQLIWAPYGGISYSPFRAYFAAFCIAVVYRIWTRRKNAWVVSLCSIAAVALGITCSMDQAVGIAVGLLAFLVLLALLHEQEFRWGAVAVYVVGAGMLFLWADRTNLTLPLRSFGGGGYSYPLLPSFPIFITLFIYMVAGCTLYRALHARFLKASDAYENPVDSSLWKSIVVPLTVAGCSMIPNALGRCDVIHITAAIPAFVVGVAVIGAMPGLWRWWFPSAIVFLALFPLATPHVAHHVKIKTVATDPALVAQGFKGWVGDNQWYESESRVTERELPCDRQYFSPSFMPISTHRFFPKCLDTGYYLGFTDVITPQTIEYKVQELRRHADEPLLMENRPLEAQLPLQLATLNTLYFESETFWVPPARHAPLTYAPIIRYIREHYVEGPVIHDGQLRIWYPSAKQDATK